MFPTLPFLSQPKDGDDSRYNGTQQPKKCSKWQVATRLQPRISFGRKSRTRGAFPSASDGSEGRWGVKLLVRAAAAPRCGAATTNSAALPLAACPLNDGAYARTLLTRGRCRELGRARASAQRHLLDVRKGRCRRDEEAD